MSLEQILSGEPIGPDVVVAVVVVAVSSVGGEGGCGGYLLSLFLGCWRFWVMLWMLLLPF